MYCLSHVAKVVLTWLVLFSGTNVVAQCTMCRDTTAGSSPKVRSGLRIAIPVLGIPAVLIFSGVIYFAVRSSKDSSIDATDHEERDRQN